MKLKLWVRILLTIILLIVDMFIYINLGYSSNWYEIVGWLFIAESFILMIEMLPEFEL